MADKEQELLRVLVDAGIVRKDATPTYPELLATVKTALDSCVKWDREKVAKWMYETLYPDADLTWEEAKKRTWTYKDQPERGIIHTVEYQGAVEQADQLYSRLAGE